MGDKLFNKNCQLCSRSYNTPDQSKNHCSSSCEAREEYYKRYPRYAPKKKKEVIYREIPEPKKEKKVISEKERWLNKKAPAKRKYQDLKDIMYRDQFKPYIPKFTQTVRG